MARGGAARRGPGQSCMVASSREATHGAIFDTKAVRIGRAVRIRPHLTVFDCIILGTGTGRAERAEGRQLWHRADGWWRITRCGNSAQTEPKCIKSKAMCVNAFVAAAVAAYLHIYYTQIMRKKKLILVVRNACLFDGRHLYRICNAPVAACVDAGE